MCGIAGFCGDFDESLLRRMTSTLAHRGPDDEGIVWRREESVGLAHRRLSIIDLSPRGHQPMWTADESMAIVFNGEIYNYRELRAKLAAQGYAFSSHSDTEVLLALYQRDGAEMLFHLNGIFAFAIWDRQRRTLFLARDHLGVKPLYYAETPNGFLFASEIKSLLAEASVARELNADAVRYHLTYLWCPAPHTMLRDVRKLEPGCAMEVRGGKVSQVWRYFDLPYDKPVEPMAISAAVESTRAALRRAVGRQMVADVPVGAFLSGGLDSSAVVAFAREFASSDVLQCFTIGFRDDCWRAEGMVDDLPYAQRVAQHLGVKLHTITVGPEMTQYLERMVYQLDEPQADTAPLHVLFISQLARQHGIKVLLSGAGGDDIFSGYRRHHALQQERHWSWFPSIARRLLAHGARSLPVSVPALRRLGRAFRYAGLDDNRRLLSYFYWTAPDDAEHLYGPRLRERDSHDVTLPLESALREIPDDAAALNKMLYLEARYFLADHNLNYTDKMAMAAGVEVRVPFLDTELVAHAARLPATFKQHGHVGKWILKKAMEPHLPREVIYRPKTGFGAPIRSWLRNELRPLVDEALSAEALHHRGLFDPLAVRQLVDRDRAGKTDGGYTIFSLLCIELWCRSFLDRRVPQYG